MVNEFKFDSEKSEVCFVNIPILRGNIFFTFIVVVNVFVISVASSLYGIMLSSLQKPWLIMSRLRSTSMILKQFIFHLFQLMKFRHGCRAPHKHRIGLNNS